MERQFKGVWIEREIYLNKNLTPTEKLLLAEIDSFSKNGVCFASNEHFADFLGITKKHVSALISKLTKMNLITVTLIYKEGSKEVDKRIISPILINTDTPPDRKGYPLPMEKDTPPDEKGYPLPIETEDKEHIKKQYKEQDKDIKKKNIKKKKSVLVDEDIEQEFIAFWELYPKKQQRSVALTSYTKARKKKKATYEDIINGLKRYIEYLKSNCTEIEFVAHASTWLNQERWNDAYLVGTLHKKAKSPMDLYRQEFGGEKNESERGTRVCDDNESSLLEFLQRKTI
jgi:hypothetical protein